MSTNPSSEERLMAAIAHAAVVVFGPGHPCRRLYSLTQKRKSGLRIQTGFAGGCIPTDRHDPDDGHVVPLGNFYVLTWIPFVNNPELLDGPPHLSSGSG